MDERSKTRSSLELVSFPPLLLNLQNKGTPHLDTYSEARAHTTQMNNNPPMGQTTYIKLFTNKLFTSSHVRAKHNESFFRVTACNRTTIIIRS